MVVVGESTENDEMSCVNQKNSWDDEALRLMKRSSKLVPVSRRRVLKRVICGV